MAHSSNVAVIPEGIQIIWFERTATDYLSSPPRLNVHNLYYIFVIIVTIKSRPNVVVVVVTILSYPTRKSIIVKKNLYSFTV